MKKNTNLFERFNELDNRVFAEFCESHPNVRWQIEPTAPFSPIDLQMTGTTRRYRKTYDIEVKSVSLDTLRGYCFFEKSKAEAMLEWKGNEVKTYVAIYYKLNKILIWNVTPELLLELNAVTTKVKGSTCKGQVPVFKVMYELPIETAYIFDFDLTKYKEEYNALHLQAGEQKKKGN